MSEAPGTITKATLKALAKLVGVRESEVRDPACPGLSVRVRKTEAVWTLRGRLLGKQSTWRLGTITDTTLSDPAKARALAVEAKQMLARGIDPAEWLRARENGGSAVRTGDPARDGWLWPDAVGAFLEAKAQDRSPKTVDDYRKTLAAPGLRGKWDKRPLKSITRAEVRAVVEGIAATGKKAQANHVLRVVKSLFSWATQEGASGIADEPSPVAQVKPKAYKAKRGHVPTTDELSAIMWRLNEAALHPGVRFAAALLVLTAQRRETIVSARSADFSPMPGMTGWGMWRMEADPALFHDRHHAVPLPPLAWGIVQTARMCAGGSPWLFPQARLRREGDVGGGHLSGKAIYEALLEAGGGEITPHDLRRALATHGPDHLRIRDDDTKKVLNHAHGKGDITSRHYAFHESMPWKVEVMGKWEGWLIELTRQGAPRLGAWPEFLPMVDAPVEVEEARRPLLLAAG